MRKRPFVLGVLASTALGLLAWGAATALSGRPDAAPGAPNIVLILCDDLGFSDIGCYGGEIDTPHIDRLAAEGTRFRQFYNDAKCQQTRASLLTGKWWPQVGGWSQARYAAPTLGERLGAAGYRTLMVGKWHAGQTPYQRGFDRHYGLTDGACNYWNPGHARPGEPEPARKGDRRWAIDGQEFHPYTPQDPDYYTTDAFTDRAIGYLEEYRGDDRPLFLYVSYTAPHSPLHAPEADVDKYRGRYAELGWDELRARRFARQAELGVHPPHTTLPPRDPDVPAWDTIPQADRARWDLRMATYAAMIDRMDRNIGRLLAKLEETGRLDNTLILFLSDNGANADDEDLSTVAGAQPWEVTSYLTQGRPWANASNTPYRLYKMTNQEGGIHTPMIAWRPRRIAPGAWSDRVGHVTDITPTLLELAGAPVPADLPGRSLAPAFEGASDPGDRTLQWAFGYWAALREGDHKIVRNTQDDPRWRLYDLAADPTEQHDIADRDPRRVQRMSAAWQAWNRATNPRYDAGGAE